ncbi:MAG: hypothetical protein ACXW2U_10335 [Telluria sp.]
MIGWLAMVWASFALAPLKRFVIEFPFVAEKVIPSPRFKRSGRTNAVHQKYRLSSVAGKCAPVDVRRNCLLQLVVPSGI